MYGIYKRKGKEGKKTNKKKNNHQGEKHKFSDNYQQTVALRLNNEQSPEELSDTSHWVLIHLQNTAAESPF